MTPDDPQFADIVPLVQTLFKAETTKAYIKLAQNLKYLIFGIFLIGAFTLALFIGFLLILGGVLIGAHVLPENIALIFLICGAVFLLGSGLFLWIVGRDGTWIKLLKIGDLVQDIKRQQ